MKTKMPINVKIKHVFVSWQQVSEEVFLNQNRSAKIQLKMVEDYI